MVTVEHWWNGSVGTANRRDIWLRYNPSGPLWEIAAREAGKTAHGEFATEEEARAVLGPLVASEGWRKLEQPARRS